MMAAPGSGWQTVLADLSLILFMVTASAVSEPRAANRAAVSGAEPVAVWRDAKGDPGLPAWLADQPRDPRQHLTIRIEAKPGEEAAALARTLALRPAGVPARLIIDPATGTDPQLTATLAFEGDPPKDLK